MKGYLALSGIWYNKDMNNQQLYELLVNIDNGHIATIEELIELSLVKEIHWHGISVIPRSIVHLVGLSNLDLRDANVSDIRLLSELTALTNLDLSNTYVSDIRPLSGLTVLKNLDLSDTYVSDIRPLAGLIALTSLDLHGSKVIDIRPLVGLTALAILDLHRTQVSDIRPLAGLTALTNLDLHGTQVSDISALSGLTALTNLDLGVTLIRDICALSNLMALTNLDLRTTKISDIRPLASLTALKNLDLSYNRDLKDIRPLSRLNSLTNLNLSDTKVKYIRPLAGLITLVNLNLNGTKVSDICSLAGLTALTNLDLSWNERITDISPLFDLHSLTNLDLSWNKQLSDISPLSSLINLTNLDLHNTDVSDISALTGLTALTCLDLRHLNLSSIPESFLDLNLDFITDDPPEGPGIYIYGLTLTEQDISIFRQSREFILKYYKSLRQEESLPINECKVVFLGDGGAGKSLIINRLMNGGEISPTFNGETTPGIDINSESYTVGNDVFELHFWDFGGEAIMHSMHRMFLTNRTLYIIVTNARENNANEQAGYWIRNVKSFAPGAPVFLIVNHRDENPFVDINVNGLQNEYPGLQDFKIISALKDSSEVFNLNVRDKILQIATSMESVHTPFAKSWLTLMNELQDMPDDRITSNAFYEKCKAKGIEKDEQVISNIINWYQDLGVCFYSRKYRSSRKYMILKPKWILNALYILIFNGRKYAKNGIILEDDIYKLIKEDVSKEKIKKVYTDIKYEENDVQYIINVLVNFDLVRRIDNDNIFIPMLCDENEPKNITGFDSDDVLHISFKYTYLPENVLYLLMIRQQHELNLKRVWRSGGILEQDSFGWKALVRVHGNQLNIYARSQNQEEYPVGLYMEILREVINKINRELGIDADEYISFRENGLEDHFSLEILEGSKNAGLLKIYSGVFKRILIIDDILGKSERRQDKLINGVIEQMLSSLTEMSEITVFKEKAGEVELTADFQQRIVSSLNLQYGIQIDRECTIGRSKTTIGETDLYFYKYENGIKEELYILENKILTDFKKPQYGQLMGYLNPYFSAGITLSINKDRGWEEAFDYICEKLEELREEGGDFAPIAIDRKTVSNRTKYVKSEFIIPKDGRTMPVYHLVMQLYDKPWHERAKKERSKKKES